MILDDPVVQVTEVKPEPPAALHEPPSVPLELELEDEYKQHTPSQELRRALGQAQEVTLKFVETGTIISFPAPKKKVGRPPKKKDQK
jgi:hypothetical protein